MYASNFLSVSEITLDIRDTEIQELEIERPSDSDEVIFTVTGHVTGIESEKVEEIMGSTTTTPLSLTVETD